MATDYFSKETSELYSQEAMPSKLILKPVVLNILGNVENLNVLDRYCTVGILLPAVLGHSYPFFRAFFPSSNPVAKLSSGTVTKPPH